MYINPQSQFRVMRDIPFDSNYRHTILFSALSSQSAFMASHVKAEYNKMTYVRHAESEIHSVKVSELADNIMDCNYCAFLNAGFGTKWFYAFITSVRYVNNNVTEIQFELDHWQTWMTELQIGQCYVEREHVANDAPGIHTVEENIPFGEYVVSSELEKDLGAGVLVQMAYDTPAGMQAGVFSGLTLQGASTAGAGSISDLLEQFSDQPEKVAFLGMCSGGMVEGSTVQTHSSGVGLNRDLGSFDFNNISYTPKNNKLYCYPYCLISVDNYNGNAETYRWEDFSSMTSATFSIHESPIPKPSVECYPTSYKGMVSAQNFGITYDNFPMCPFIIDTYRAWASQAIPKMLLSTGTEIVSGVMAGGLEGAVSSLVNQAPNLANFALDNQYKRIHGTTYGGSIAGSGMNFAYNRIGFRFLLYTIKPEFAKIVDDYFTRFGYKVLTYKVPETRSRSSFNYVKTIESTVEGNIPQEAIDVLENSLNAGITFWHTANVKNFDLQNDIVEDESYSL